MLDFKKVACVTLNRRPERWDRFLKSLPSSWPFRQVEPFAAIDGNQCPPPEWWKAGKYAWGCYKSHLNILEQCLNQKIESCLFLEDDAICCENFVGKVNAFANELPSDWEMIYLGGQHLHPGKFPPLRVSENVYIPYNVNRTHAFAIRGQAMMSWVYQHLNRARIWKDKHHIDHHLGRVHQTREKPIYCPGEWLIGQNEGKSDISWKQCDLRFFPPARQYLPTGFDFVAVMGLHCSGASEIAAILSQLGVHLGGEAASISRFSNRKNGIELKAPELYGLMEAYQPVPSLKGAYWIGKVMGELASWIRERSFEVHGKGTVLGAAHPLFCKLGGALESMLYGRLKVVSVERSTELATASLARLQPGHSAASLTTLQKDLSESKSKFLQTTSAPVYSIDLQTISNDPISEIERLCQFLEIQPAPNQIELAVNTVRAAA